MSININVFENMMKSSTQETKKSILFRINILIDYADFVSKLEAMIKQNSDSDYIIMKLDQDRREKHDMAISCIQDLNEISADLGLGKFYEGCVNDENRSAIAQAIYEFSKYYLDHNQIKGDINYGKDKSTL